MTDEQEQTCTCGHSINWHRFLKRYKPDACMHTTKTLEGWDQYCPCNKYKEQARQ